MNIAAVIGVCLCAAAAASMLRRYHQEYAFAVSAAAGVIVLIALLSALAPAAEEIRTLISSAGISSASLQILFKSLGICFLAQFAADACRDAGEGALASRVELAGKLAIVVLSLPLFESIAKTAAGLIGAS